jgi:hypothetical protein
MFEKYLREQYEKELKDKPVSLYEVEFVEWVEIYNSINSIIDYGNKAMEQAELRLIKLGEKVMELEI